MVPATILAGPETEMELKVGLLEPPPLLLEPPPQPTNNNAKISAIDNGARCARMKELLALEIGVVYLTYEGRKVMRN